MTCTPVLASSYGVNKEAPIHQLTLSVGEGLTTSVRESTRVREGVSTLSPTLEWVIGVQQRMSWSIPSKGMCQLGPIPRSYEPPAKGKVLPLQKQVGLDQSVPYTGTARLGQ
jgi:hypothetical protein